MGALSKVLSPPFSWTPPDVHVIPAPAEVGVLGLVPMDQKSASGDYIGPLHSVCFPKAVPIGVHCLAHWKPVSGSLGVSVCPLDAIVMPQRLAQHINIILRNHDRAHKAPTASEAAQSMAVSGQQTAFMSCCSACVSLLVAICSKT